MENGQYPYTRQEIVQCPSVLFGIFTFLYTKFQFCQSYFRDETIIGVYFLKLGFKVELAFHVENGNVGVNEIFLQSGSICLVDILLLRISVIISSAVLFDSNAPNAFLKVDFLLAKSVLTDTVNLEMRSSLSFGLKLFKSPMYPSTIVVFISDAFINLNLAKKYFKVSCLLYGFFSIYNRPTRPLFNLYRSLLSGQTAKPSLSKTNLCPYSLIQPVCLAGFPTTKA